MASSSGRGSPERLPSKPFSAPKEKEKLPNEKQSRTAPEQTVSMPQSPSQKTGGASNVQQGDPKLGQSTQVTPTAKKAKEESVQKQVPNDSKTIATRTLSPDSSEASNTDDDKKVRKSIIKSPSPEPPRKDSGSEANRALSPDTSETSCTDGFKKVRKSIMKTPSPEPQKRDSGCSLSSEDMTPSHHRRVSFADEVGLDLDDCHEFPDNLEFDYLQSLWQTDETTYKVTPLFDQPFSDFKKFTAKLEERKICLENIASEETRIYGSIRVMNIAYEKIVFVRATFDHWQSCRDYFANYATSIGRQDVFSFEIDFKAENLPQDRESILKFCICYEVIQTQYWDSNDEQNYELMITPIKKGDDDPDSALESDYDKSNFDNDDELESEESKSAVWSEIKKKSDLVEKKNYSDSEKKAKDDNTSE